MELLLVRHARARDRDKFALGGKSDAMRPLTREGIKRFSASLPAFNRVVPELGLIVSSPWIRAWQTAELLAGEFGLSPEKLDALIPPVDFDALCQWLNHREAEVVALVGHEPDFGELASRFLCAGGSGFMPLKKGGACLLHFPGRIGEGRGELRWLMSPVQLRMIAGKEI